jgi:hypothetical protein
MGCCSSTVAAGFYGPGRRLAESAGLKVDALSGMPVRNWALARAVNLRSNVILVSSLSLLGLVGCSAADGGRPIAPDSPAALTELLSAMSARCPDRTDASSREGAVRDQLFVEAAILNVSSSVAAGASLANLQDLPQTAQTQLLAVPHLIADFDHRAEMVWGQSDPRPQSLSINRWSVLPRRADHVLVLDVEAKLELPSPHRATSATGRTVTFSTTVRENEPALARVEWDAAARRSLLILLRTFEVHGEPELRAIFECKMQQRAAALGRAGGVR